MDATTTAKRARAGEQPDFRMTFQDPSEFHTIIKILETVTAKANLRIAKMDDKYYLTGTSSDMNETTAIYFRLLLEDPLVRTDEEVFCISCKTINNILYDSTTCLHLALTIEGHGDKVCLIMRNTTDRVAHKKCFDVPTYVDSDQQRRIDDISYTMTIECDVAKMREMAKAARKANTDTLRLRVYIVPRGNHQQVSLVEISFTGMELSSNEQFCHEVVKHDDGSLVVRAAADGEHGLFDIEAHDPTFDGNFLVDKIEAFLKHIKDSMIQAHVGMDANGEALPILFVHPLRGASDDKSKIRYLVAPQAHMDD